MGGCAWCMSKFRSINAGNIELIGLYTMTRVEDRFYGASGLQASQSILDGPFGQLGGFLA
jgi:hypothetical protein